jgi:tetratricopeptide (TPR) repeat protein
MVAAFTSPFFTAQTQAYEGTLTMAWDAYYTGGIQTISTAITPWLSYLKERAGATIGGEKQETQALLCRFLQLAGVVAREQGDMVSALSLADQAVLLAGHLKNADLVTTASIRKAATFAEQGGTDAAIMTLQAAIKAAQKAQDPSRCYLMMYLAKMYAQSPGNHHERAKAFRLLDDVETTLRSKGQLADDGSFMKIDQSGFFMLRGEVFRRYDQYDEAETSLKLVGKDLGLRRQGNLLVAKAELAQARNDRDAVEEYARGALTIAEKTGSSTMKKKALALQ